jgi:hypothetical protein
MPLWHKPINKSDEKMCNSDKIFTLLECFVIAYWSHLQMLSSPRRLLDFLILADGMDGLPQNVGKESPIYARLHPKRTKILYTLWQEPEITQSTSCFINKIENKIIGSNENSAPLNS